MGFIKYNGMTAEQFVWAWLKSEFLMPKKLMFLPDVYKRQIIGKGWQRPKRLYKLGEEYTNDRIMERIRENSYAVKFQSFSEPQQIGRAHV